LFLVGKWKYVVVAVGVVFVVIVVGIGGFKLLQKPDMPEFQSLASNDLSKGVQVIDSDVDGAGASGTIVSGAGGAGITSGSDADGAEVAESPQVLVDIKGAVVNPGVYQLNANARVIDVIVLAGGLLAEADTMQINLASTIYDAMAIIIPKKGEIVRVPVGTEDVSGSTGIGATQPAKININTASLSQLMSLSGIGEVKAREIISYRERVGGFGKIEDLMRVSGIGSVTFAKIKDFIMI